MDSSDATDKPVDVMQSGSNGSCFEEVFAGEDIGSGSSKRLLAETMLRISSRWSVR